MGSQQNKTEQCLVLVKALPHPSSKYSETVCCAGIAPDTDDPAGAWSWRRQYPVPYRMLKDDQAFRRWDWISYEYRPRKSDRRVESRSVQSDSLKVIDRLNDPLERARYVRRMVRESTNDAESRSESLCLIEPHDVRFSWKRRTHAELTSQRRKHQALADQLNLLDGPPPEPLEPCPFAFYFDYTSSDGERHRHSCEDWETSTAFFRRRRSEGGEDAALESLRKTYEEEYPRRGMLFAMGTHSVHPIWLLVGVLRVDPDPQSDMFL